MPDLTLFWFTREQSLSPIEQTFQPAGRDDRHLWKSAGTHWLSRDISRLFYHIGPIFVLRTTTWQALDIGHWSPTPGPGGRASKSL